MLKGKKILSGIFATVVGLSVALPMTASADEHWDHVHRWERDHHERVENRDAHYREWAWHRDHDHYSAYTYAPGYGYHPANGAGMIDPRNPRLMWACDSEGHHCHWAPR